MLKLGKLVATPGVLAAVPKRSIRAAIGRHLRGDWGDVNEDDWKENDNAVKNGERVLSFYRAPDGTKFWIITEWDRSYTTVLLPEEY